jgi:hypothetical protein
VLQCARIGTLRVTFTFFKVVISFMEIEDLWPVFRSLPLDRTPNDLNPAYIFTFCISEVHFNTFLEATSRYRSGLRPWSFPANTLYGFITIFEVILTVSLLENTFSLFSEWNTCFLLAEFVYWTMELLGHPTVAPSKTFQIINSITFNQDLNEVQKLVAGLNCI